VTRLKKNFTFSKEEAVTRKRMMNRIDWKIKQIMKHDSLQPRIFEWEVPTNQFKTNN
jgi:hypothetical protein